MREFESRPNKDGRTDLEHCRFDDGLYVVDAIDQTHARLIPADPAGAPYANATPVVVHRDDIETVNCGDGL